MDTASADRDQVGIPASGDALTLRVPARLKLCSGEMRLAFLAPDIVEGILDGYQPADQELERLLKGIPISWDAQRRAFGFSRA